MCNAGDDHMDSLEIINLAKFYGTVKGVDKISSTVKKRSVCEILEFKGKGKTITINMCELFLVEASKKYEKLAMDYRQEYLIYGEKHINGSSGFIAYDDYDEWLKKVETQKLIQASDEDTPATTFFTVRKEDNKIIGSIQLRHHLTEELIKDGGNVGYGICPSERGKGYGGIQLALVLLQAKALQIKKIMITCDKSNIASAKIAIKNGAILTGEGFDVESQTMTEIYWIDLKES